MNLGRVKKKIKLSRGEKEVYHIEIETNISYKPGDILKVYPKNRQYLKDDLNMQVSDEELDQFDLRIPSPKLLALAATEKEELKGIVSPANFFERKKYMMNNTVPEVLKGTNFSFVDIKQALMPMRSRSYSICSSNNFYRDEVHILVALDKFVTDRGVEYGTASRYIVEDLNIGDEIRIEHKSNSKFWLPENLNSKIIMIGPGTGIAPFIGFLQEKSDNNWLFFGERKYEDNFYYRSFINELVENGNLKLNTAFSRDQKEKHYVQDELLKEKLEVKRWIEEGAYIYVCGDAKKMAQSVEKALLEILDENPSSASNKLNYLKENGRYLLDVY